jgi:hypothetical protein
MIDVLVGEASKLTAGTGISDQELCKLVAGGRNATLKEQLVRNLARQRGRHLLERLKNDQGDLALDRIDAPDQVPTKRTRRGSK